MEHFFSRIQVETCAQIHTRVKLLGGEADVDQTQIIWGGIQSNYWRDISPPSPQGFSTPAIKWLFESLYSTLPNK